MRRKKQFDPELGLCDYCLSMKTPSLSAQIDHAFKVMRTPEFFTSDSPLWAAQRHPLLGVAPETIAAQIVDLQFHGF